MVPTPGCCARDDMGAAFAGVFWGVLDGLLADGAFMTAGVVAVVMSGYKFVCGGGEESDLRGGIVVHFLVADWLRHLGEWRCRYAGGELLRVGERLLVSVCRNVRRDERGQPLRKVVAPQGG